MTVPSHHVVSMTFNNNVFFHGFQPMQESDGGVPPCVAPRTDSGIHSLSGHEAAKPKHHNLNEIITVQAYSKSESDHRQQWKMSFTDLEPIGRGTFGIVHRAKLVDSSKDSTEQGEIIAIKKTLLKQKVKNRELHILLRLDHLNIVKLKYYFASKGRQEELYCNLVMEYFPATLYTVARYYRKQGQTVPILYTKLYMYQLFRGLAYIHSKDICHRDIKPQNLLVNPKTGVLKLCDFGNAKQLVRGERNVTNNCPLFYRAPELLFGAVHYTTQIDIWSAGCVLSELLLGKRIFTGCDECDQLVEIIKVLGTPTYDELGEMNPVYQQFYFPQLKTQSWSKIFQDQPWVSFEAIDLINKILKYAPLRRIAPLEACAHIFFYDLRCPSTKLPTNHDLPPLFNFTPDELSINPSLNSRLIPSHMSPNTSICSSDSMNEAQNIQSSPTSTIKANGLSGTSTPSTTISNNTCKRMNCIS